MRKSSFLTNLLFTIALAYFMLGHKRIADRKSRAMNGNGINLMG